MALLFKASYLGYMQQNQAITLLPNIGKMVINASNNLFRALKIKIIHYNPSKTIRSEFILGLSIWFDLI